MSHMNESEGYTSKKEIIKEVIINKGMSSMKLNKS